jgi:hypothetical protein
MKVCLGLHDFSVYNTELDLLLRLKSHFPNFKVSLFTIPIDIRRQRVMRGFDREKELKRIKQCLDWIQIIPHGRTHNSGEATRWEYTHFREEVIPSIKRAFDKDGLPFIKGFAAPHWRWNNDVVCGLNDEGWWGSISPVRKMLSTKRFYQYSYAINEPFYPSTENVLKLHGHITSTRNALGICLDNLLKLPLETEWHFVTDFIEDL